MMDDLLKYCLELERELIAAEAQLDKRMLALLRPKTLYEMKEILEVCGRPFLEHIMLMATETQDYEICEAVKQIMNSTA